MSESNVAPNVAAHLAAIVASSDDIIVSKTLEGVITSWNPSAERILGYTAAEAVGNHIRLIIPHDRWAEEDEVLARIRRGERVEHFETIRRTKDGRLLNISLTVSPIRDSDGTIVGASKVARDVTERRLAEQELEASADRGKRFSRAGRRGQPSQGRVPCGRVPRTSHAAERDYGLGVAAENAEPR